MPKSPNSIVKEFIASYENDVLNKTNIEKAGTKVIQGILDDLKKYVDIKYPISKVGRRKASTAQINWKLWRDCQLSALSLDGGILYLISMFDKKSIWGIKYNKSASPFGGQCKRLVRMILTMESMGFIKYNEPTEKIQESYNFLSQYIKMCALSGYREQYREFEDNYPKDLKKIDNATFKEGIASIKEFYSLYFHDTANGFLENIDFLTFMKGQIAFECFKQDKELEFKYYGKSPQEWEAIQDELVSCF